MKSLNDVMFEITQNLTGGKGTERHGGVEDGDWVQITRTNGPGFLTGQAHKKFLEAMKFEDPERRRREIVGAIGYLVLYLMNDSGADRTRLDDHRG